MINPELDRLARARYVSLTTFGRNGAPVSTPVWVASEGGFLQVLCHDGDAVVQRLASGAAVTVAPCDQRGGVQGDAVDATATVIADPGLVARAQALIGRRYGAAARAMRFVDRMRGKSSYVVLAIDVPEGRA